MENFSAKLLIFQGFLMPKKREVITLNDIFALLFLELGLGPSEGWRRKRPRKDASQPATQLCSCSIIKDKGPAYTFLVHN